ncbi:MAG: ATP-binding cassette domain-containing protein [Pseudomonadota bacterium]
MIELTGAGFAYGRDRVLSDLSLRLDAGSFQFLTGNSGAGKTTLLRLCYGDLKPDAGTVHLFQKDSLTLDRDGLARTRQRIGVVHQDCRFLDHLTVFDNVALPLMAAGRDLAAHAQDVAQLIDWVGLRARSQARPPELSGGERQRAALARAIIMDPDVILADEPTGNVDWEMSQRLLTLLAELHRLGKAILLATHDLPLIRAAKQQVSARVLRLVDGRVHVAGTDL